MSWGRRGFMRVVFEFLGFLRIIYSFWTQTLERGERRERESVDIYIPPIESFRIFEGQAGQVRVSVSIRQDEMNNF